MFVWAQLTIRSHWLNYKRLKLEREEQERLLLEEEKKKKLSKKQLPTIDSNPLPSSPYREEIYNQEFI